MSDLKNKRLFYPLFLITILFLGSCLRAKIDNTKFYILTPLDKVSLQQINQPENKGPYSKNVRFILGPVTIPNYLERSTIANRESNNRLTYSEEHRWAEPLEQNILRVLVENFEMILPNSEIQSIEKYGKRNLKYQLEIHFSQFESTEKGSVLLAARWKLYKRKNHKLVITQDEFFSMGAENKSVGAKAAALSQLLANLTVKIAHTAFPK